MNREKPPLGLVPKYIHDERRMKDILGALERYSDASLPVPTEWVQELSSIINERFPAK
ncbi:hypothetical protein [Burkholderia ambifaria]|uniref:hypothetical protein n=1 Tax=Burkholderia ambifaria TaxID=152480 RepID=UPI0015886267|nr:hypothetical protein [Burkholderia ambifaria]MBR8344215.1 hypothetical protein [Burkholderia ambifaria]